MHLSMRNTGTVPAHWKCLIIDYPSRFHVTPFFKYRQRLLLPERLEVKPLSTALWVIFALDLT